MSENRKAMLISSLVTLPVAVIIMLIPLFIEDQMYPVTAIGTAGLENVKKYCIAFILTRIISILLVPVWLWIFDVIYRALSHEQLFTKKVRMVIIVIITVIYIISTPHVLKFELQARQNGYHKFSLVKAAMLSLDINKDLRSNESHSKEKDMIYLKTTDFQYKVPVRQGRFSYGTNTVNDFEYGIYDESENLLGQISREDYHILSKGVFQYVPHRIETYQYSGLIKTIDDSEVVENKPIKIELTFDYDEGILRRELLCEDEEVLPDMRLQITIDGEHSFAGRINSRTEISFKPRIPGHFEAWIELCPKNGYSVVISNVIEYDQTKYVD